MCFLEACMYHLLIVPYKNNLVPCICICDSCQVFLEHDFLLEKISRETSIFIVTEGNEPPFFTRFFTWDSAKSAVSISVCNHFSLFFLLQIQKHNFLQNRFSSSVSYGSQINDFIFNHNRHGFCNHQSNLKWNILARVS